MRYADLSLDRDVTMIPAPTIPLNDSREIPQLGLGVYKALDGDEVRAVRHALDVGYRHVDTAVVYGNEAGVAEGIRTSGVDRDEVFVTTKVWNDDIRAGNTIGSVEGSLARMQFDYLDLVLLHWPVDNRLKAWEDLVALRERGLVRSIGVSNFTAAHLEELIDASGVPPALDQIEFHPFLQQLPIVEACRRHKVAISAWSPLMQGKGLDEPLLNEIAARHGRSPAQVILRWDIQHGIIPLPKSVTPDRIEENFGVFDFGLADAEMLALNGLDRNHRYGPDPDNFAF